MGESNSPAKPISMFQMSTLAKLKRVPISWASNILQALELASILNSTVEF